MTCVAWQRMCTQITGSCQSHLKVAEKVAVDSHCPLPVSQTRLPSVWQRV